MHELSIAQALIGQVQRIAAAEGQATVSGIVVSVGSLSGVDAEALRFAFPMAADGTALESVDLVIEQVNAIVKCNKCGETTSPKYPFVACVKCGSTDVELIAGRELQLKSIEVES